MTHKLIQDEDPALDAVFAALSQSSFRSHFRLNSKELSYLQDKTLLVVLDHAADFIATRIAPATPPNDGKQTPWRGHPVFLAQHATATCCRGCLAKWHKIPKGQDLTETEQGYIVRVIARWLQAQEQQAEG